MRYFHVFRGITFNILKKKMIKGNVSLESRVVEAESIAAELRTELVKLQAVVNALQLVNNTKTDPTYQDLIKENERLRRDVDLFKKQLSGRESNASILSATKYNQDGQGNNDDSKANPELSAPIKVLTGKNQTGGNSSKEKAPSAKKPPTEKGTSDEPPVDIGRLDLRVGRIVDIKKHPDADSLYVEQVDVGEEKPRTVVSGLVKFVPIEAMQNRLVVVLCNLKPAKMRGVTSEGMVMCASTPEKVEVLSPPPSSVPGDVIEVAGFPRLPDPVLNPKKKIFETVAPDLRTDNQLVATYRGVPWTISGKGIIKTDTLINVNIK